MANYYIPLVATPQIGEGGGGGGSDLPAVTAADNGDVLTVVNGAWDKAAPSGGGGVLVVTIAEDGVCDKTWQEIHDAFASTGAVFSIDDALSTCTEVGFSSRAQNYYVVVVNKEYVATTASDYPVLDEE